ncbi:hypothetical protein ACE01N_16720 [Saccharicrinis sp. FJH2]|uniref:hypothetical protein n=1 Tax=Saccharicrinis sp. FJH65 TaxID=3344659 RepID=UPI0035F2B5ED
MRQEDFILREIQKIGELLLGIIGKLQKKQDVAEINNELEELESITDLSVDKILRMEPVKMVQVLEKLEQFNIQNMELFARTLFEMHTLFDRNRSNMMLERALFILEYLEEREKTFSMTRQDLMSSIKKEYV